MTQRGPTLPPPSCAAQQASDALLAQICAEIDQSTPLNQADATGASGAISFARYMELALYHPGLGYYSGGSTKLGRDGDFTTAPEMSPLFGQALARAARALLPHGPLRILEFGAGSGQLAHAVLCELQALDIPVAQYAILELSGSLRARQQAILHQFPQVCWLEQWPEPFSDTSSTLVLANEVLDAMPVHVVQKQDRGWQELRVGHDAGRLVWRTQACSEALMASIAQQIPDADALVPGYTTELHLVAGAFIPSLADLLCSSSAPCAAILIDYGFAAHEYYLPQRRQGTLYCHYRHHAHDDPFYLPGLQDITAHVDFSHMARQAQGAGLDVLSYSTQAAFLLDSGITDCLLRIDPADTSRYLPQANALQKFISPAEMGELFKVLVLGKACHLPQQYERNNRCYRL